MYKIIRQIYILRFYKIYRLWNCEKNLLNQEYGTRNLKLVDQLLLFEWLIFQEFGIYVWEDS